MIEARARTDAEPDSLVSHQTRVNCTNLLPKRENACPAKITQNLAMDRGFSSSVVGSVMMKMDRFLRHFTVSNVNQCETPQFHPPLPGHQRSVELFNHGCRYRLPVNLMAEYNPRIHVVELTDPGFRYYRGAFRSFEEVPPRYTWKKVDFRVEDTVVYVDLQGASVDG